MKRIKDEVKLFIRTLKQQAVFMVLLGTFFIVAGSVIPKLYTQYIDKHNYVEFVGNVGFDKKVYQKCDTITALATFRSDLDTATILITRLNKIVDTSITPVYRFPDAQSFANKTPPEGTLYTIPVRLPCDKVNFTPGAYYFEGQIKYSVNGVEKISPFRSGLFTIEDEPENN